MGPWCFLKHSLDHGDYCTNHKKGGHEDMVRSAKMCVESLSLYFIHIYFRNEHKNAPYHEIQYIEYIIKWAEYIIKCPISIGNQKQSIRLRDDHRTAPFTKAHPQQRSQRRLQRRKEQWCIVRESYILSRGPRLRGKDITWLPSGKRLDNYGKSHFFHSYVSLPEGNCWV